MSGNNSNRSGAYSSFIPTQHPRQNQTTSPSPQPSPSTVRSPSDGESENDVLPEKKKIRRNNQNIASRNYRLRKKEYVKDLEQRIEQLTLENEQLKRDSMPGGKNSAINKDDLIMEAMRMEPTFSAMFMEVCQIVQRLDDALQKNEDDKTLAYLLQLIHLTIDKRNAAFEKDLEKVINPFAQARLAVLGYVPNVEKTGVGLLLMGPTEEAWWNKFFDLAKVGAEHQEKILAILADCRDKDAELRKERIKLDEQIKNFFLTNISLLPMYPHLRLDDDLHPVLSQASTPITYTSLSEAAPNPNVNPYLHHNPYTQLSVSDVVLFIRHLEAMRKSFTAQRCVMYEAYAKISKILTPRQEAIMIVRIQRQQTYDPANTQVVWDMWKSLSNNSNNVDSGPSIPFLLGNPPPYSEYQRSRSSELSSAHTLTSITSLLANMQQQQQHGSTSAIDEHRQAASQMEVLRATGLQPPISASKHFSTLNPITSTIVSPHKN